MEDQPTVELVPWEGGDLVASLSIEQLFSAEADEFMEDLWSRRAWYLREWVAEGLTQTQIAKKVGRSQATVSGWMKKFGVKPAQVHPPKPRADLSPPDNSEPETAKAEPEPEDAEVVEEESEGHAELLHELEEQVQQAEKRAEAAEERASDLQKKREGELEELKRKLRDAKRETKELRETLDSIDDEPELHAVQQIDDSAERMSKAIAAYERFDLPGKVAERSQALLTILVQVPGWMAELAHERLHGGEPLGVLMRDTLLAERDKLNLAFDRALGDLDQEIAEFLKES